MGKIGCTIDGNLDDSKFSEPMPWIGIYVAAASAACALAMLIDVLRGLRRRKFWFPCYYFSLNATTLTLLTVATKLSVDLNTSMPRRQDQLTKLSSATLICTVIANFFAFFRSHGEHRAADEHNGSGDFRHHSHREHWHTIRYWCYLRFQQRTHSPHVSYAYFASVTDLLGLDNTNYKVLFGPEI